jgi:hypothetical protein
MALTGLAITLAGFVVSAASVGIAAGTGARLVIVLVGIIVSLFGIIGLINPAYSFDKNAIWKR